MKKKLNQSGQASAEFLFSIIIAFSLFLLFLSISFTFTVTEIAQYVAFSTARAQAGSNKDQAAQRDAATNKYQAFNALPAFGLLFKSNWFTFAKTPDVRQGAGTDFRKELGDGASGANPQFAQVYTGASISFQAKVLGVKIPFLSSGSGNDDDAGFKTNINAVLIRESSQAECYQYWDQRAQALRQLPSGGSSFYNPGEYIRMEDAGC